MQSIKDECITCAAYRKQQDYLEKKKLGLITITSQAATQLSIDQVQEQWSLHIQYHESTFFPKEGSNRAAGQ